MHPRVGQAADADTEPHFLPRALAACQSSRGQRVPSASYAAAPSRRPDMTIRPAPPAVLAPLLFLMACAPAGAGRDPQSAPPPPRAAERQATRPLPADLNIPLPREANADDPLCAPLLIEQDFGFGTHVVMRRLPSAADLEDMRFLSGLRQVVLALPEWPRTY